ncbi:MAG: Flp pilus assembly complex ATPase component TadA [Holosporaceae bacterium]|jgi:type II secretory ATPase GspE/PulE/Tfp pilus assembly ATPase PilB-like protein|nr:Flp pilus assembly complex ATPase component TadA [Holosporaceae bacterium]
MVIVGLRLGSIGETLFNRGLLTKEQIPIVVKSQKKSNLLFGQAAVGLGFLKEEDLLKILSELYSIEIVSLEFLYINKETLTSIDYEAAASCFAVPFFRDDKIVKVAVADPGNLRAIDAVNTYFPNQKVKFFIAKETEILRFLEAIKCDAENIEKDPLLLLNKIIFDAVELKASDIHFEPSENLVRVRLRVDGVLRILKTIDFDSWMRIKSRLKLIANLNITENRRPQSGHTRIYLAGKSIDLRISTHPGILGENFVVRIFDLSNGIAPLLELGFSEDDFLWLRRVISFPSGIFLIVGPTGSGKTTTLYSLLKEINSLSVNIMTLEDPVEYQIDGVRQLDLREEGILSFADGVRSILRQDPDVMLVGEIRDEATAATAVRASLTGRLVLATLHAATPLEGIRRLLDLGLKLSDFIPSLIGIFSQRLVRYLVDGEYRGRFPLTEYIYFSEELKKHMSETEDITLCKVDKSFQDSSREALDKCLTDLREIERVLGNVHI